MATNDNGLTPVTQTLTINEAYRFLKQRQRDITNSQINWYDADTGKPIIFNITT